MGGWRSMSPPSLHSSPTPTTRKHVGTGGEALVHVVYKYLLRIYYVPSAVLEHREIGTVVGKERKLKKVTLLSRVRLFATPWTVTYQNSPSMGLPRQEY